MVTSGDITGRDRFHRVECDLSDVLGSPGIDAGPGLVAELEGTLGGSWATMPAGGGVFVAGSPGAAGEAGAVGAFAPMRRPQRALTDAVLAPGRSTGGADLVSTMRSSTGEHEVWQQLVRGAPVLGAVYGLHQGTAGQLSLSGRPLGDLVARDPGPMPVVAPREIRRAMIAALDLPGRAAIEIEAVVFPVGGDGIWAFKGECLLARPIADLRIFLAADDLSLLLSYDVACSAGYGEGSAYRVSPSRAADPIPVLLDELGPDSRDLLRGPALDVRPARGEPVAGVRGDYRVEPSASTFNQVSAYYHVRKALRWFAQILGPELLAQPPFTPLSVVTDDRRVGAQVAIYVPAEAAIRFHSGSRNGARSADIVVHEVTHAVADRLCRLNRSAGTQAKSLSEGYADYAAASALDDPRFGDYVKNVPDGARNCADPALRFPPDFAGEGEPYTSGAVWAAVLWDLRSAVGSEVADAVALHSLSYLTPNITFPQALGALIEADRILFDSADGAGRHAADIQRCYEGRLP